MFRAICVATFEPKLTFPAVKRHTALAIHLDASPVTAAFIKRSGTLFSNRTGAGGFRGD
jgi:hypothetical protein